MIKKIDHFVITTSGVEQCKDFYTTLGFEWRDGGGRYELFAADFKINVHVLGAELKPNAKHATVGSSDVCFEVDGDLNMIKTDLQNKGLKIELGIVDRTGCKGKMKSLYLRDYDGNLIELCSYNS